MWPNSPGEYTPPTVSDIKKWLKHAKNPFEKKALEKQLRTAHRVRA